MISDEIRKVADEYDVLPLYGLADRIDSETVELPKDADGREVPLDTKELYDANGKKVNITSFAFFCDAYGYWSYWKAHTPDTRCDDGMFYVDELYLTPSDNWERMANELDEMVDASDSADDRCEKLADLADRIRKLAKREGEQCQ